MTKDIAVAKLDRIIVILLAASAIMVGLITLTESVKFRNYAQVASRPLESVLAEGGAVKKCSNGDPGYGPDNSEPWLETRYIFPGGKAAAEALITKSASRNGFILKPEDSNIRSLYWYSSTGKKSTYPGFDHGNVTVRFSLYTDASKKALYCGKSALPADSSHTAIVLSVGLPSWVQ